MGSTFARCHTCEKVFQTRSAVEAIKQYLSHKHKPSINTRLKIEEEGTREYLTDTIHVSDRSAYFVPSVCNQPSLRSKRFKARAISFFSNQTRHQSRIVEGLIPTGKVQQRSAGLNPYIRFGKAPSVRPPSHTKRKPYFRVYCGQNHRYPGTVSSTSTSTSTTVMSAVVYNGAILTF